MIIDCHTHVDMGTDEVQTSEHLEAAEKVDVCIVLAGPDDSSDKVNKRLSEYVNRHSEKMIGFAVVEPSQDNISTKNLTFIRDKLGLMGTVLYCSRCGFHPTHSRAMQFYESAEKLGLPVFFHNGGTLGPNAILEYAQPYLLDAVAKQFLALKIVIGTMGLPFTEQTLAMLAKHENVYADLTIRPSNVWQVYNIVVSAHEYGVMGKLLFGSGYPQAHAGQCMETLLGFNKLLADTNLPTVPRVDIQGIIERDTLELLGIKSSEYPLPQAKSMR